MKILPVVSLALAAALATSVLPVVPSYAAQYPNQAQNCGAAGTSTEGVGDCKNNRGLRGFANTMARHGQTDPAGVRSASAAHAASAGRSGGKR
jgi:hypothetical protein